MLLADVAGTRGPAGSLHERGRYYYNVVFWLDRALFAPPYLRERTRLELAAFAAEERPPQLPSALSRATRRWVDQLTRSRASVS